MLRANTNGSDLPAKIDGRNVECTPELADLIRIRLMVVKGRFKCLVPK